MNKSRKRLTKYFENGRLEEISTGRKRDKYRKKEEVNQERQIKTNKVKIRQSTGNRCLHIEETSYSINENKSEQDTKNTSRWEKTELKPSRRSEENADIQIINEITTNKSETKEQSIGIETVEAKAFKKNGNAKTDVVNTSGQRNKCKNCCNLRRSLEVQIMKHEIIQHRLRNVKKQLEAEKNKQTLIKRKVNEIYEKALLVEI